MDSRNAYYSAPSRRGGVRWLIGVGLLRVLHSARAGDQLWLPGAPCFVERTCFHDTIECLIDNVQQGGGGPLSETPVRVAFLSFIKSFVQIF